MNSRRLRQEPCWTPTFTLNSSFRLQPICNWILAFSYILCMRPTSHSSLPSLQTAHQITHLGTQLNAFSRSRKAMYGIDGATSWHEVKTACHRYALFVIGSSLPAALAPSWPGLGTWGIDSFLAQGQLPQPCCRGNDDTLLPFSGDLLKVDDILEEVRGHFKKAHELLNLRVLKISILHKNPIFQRMNKIFCVEFQRVPLKFHTKYLTHTLKDTDFIHKWRFKSS